MRKKYLLVVLLLMINLLFQVGYVEALEKSPSEIEAELLEKRQYELDKQNAPEIQEVKPSDDSVENQEIQDGATNVKTLRLESEEQQENLNATAPTSLKVNLLDWGKNVDKNNLTFSWYNNYGMKQVAYKINLFNRKQDEQDSFSTGWIASSNNSSVFIDNVGAVLENNELYYWTVEVKYEDNTILTSEKTPFSTALGDGFEASQLVWTNKPSVANLYRAKINLKKPVEKALLSVTAMDT